MYNAHISLPLLAWGLAQLAKFAAKAWRGQLNWRLLYGSGGMPSAHAAAVAALATTSFVLDGPTSPLFGVSAVVAGIVLYDSLGVRRAAGDQAVAIQAILERLEARTGEPVIALRKVLGHQPIEVIAGGLLGGVVALGGTLAHWRESFGVALTLPLNWEHWLYLGIFGFLLLTALVSRLGLGRWWLKPVATVRELRQRIVWQIVPSATVGLLLVLAQDQQVRPLGWRIWIWLLLGLTVIAGVFLLGRWLRGFSERYQADIAAHQAAKRAKRSSKRRHH